MDVVAGELCCNGREVGIPAARDHVARHEVGDP
jgi:hypothetical protein